MEQIRARFEDLNPYDPTTVTDDLLELEDENFADPKARTGRRELWCYGISAKRYVLYNHDDQDELVLRGWSQLDTATDIGEHEEPTE